MFQAVDEHGMPGMDRVDRLAECLVELMHQTKMTLDNQQVSKTYIVQQLFVYILYKQTYIIYVFFPS